MTALCTRNISKTGCVDMKNTHQQAPHTCGHQAIYADTQKNWTSTLPSCLNCCAEKHKKQNRISLSTSRTRQLDNTGSLTPVPIFLPMLWIGRGKCQVPSTSQVIIHHLTDLPKHIRGGQQSQRLFPRHQAASKLRSQVSTAHRPNCWWLEPCRCMEWCSGPTPAKYLGGSSV